jgi:uncharacterized protein YggE
MPLPIHLSLRDFTLLEQIEEMIATQNDFRIASVSWAVDRDNPGWTIVRKEAIEGALQKAMEYAAALGSTLVSIEHVADLGLLGGSESESRTYLAAGAAATAARGDRSAVPKLDAVPQRITAGIEARLRITPVQVPPSR